MPNRKNSRIGVTSLTPELRNKVFGNELILDQIFQYLLPNEEGTPMNHILTCRLVDHSWYTYATKLLKLTSGFVFTLDFKYWKESKEKQTKREKQYQVQNFFDTWATLPDANFRIPSFYLRFPKLSGNVETAVLYDLAKCLVQCGYGLNSMELDLSSNFLISKEAIPTDLAVEVRKFHLPKLNDLKVYLSFKEDNRSLVTLLVNHVFSSCSYLTSLSVHQEFWKVKIPLTRLFSTEGLSETEHLPDTLEEIEIHVSMTPQLLEKLFLQNFLPKLTKLNLLIPIRADYKETIFRILDRFRLQLTWFYCIGYFQDEEDYLGTLVRFPVMDKVKFLYMRSLQFESVPQIDQHFPVLEELVLSEQTTSVLQAWTRNCHFNCVTELSIRIEAENDKNFTLELSRHLPQAFPHVQKLELGIGGLVEDGAMQNIFHHMTQLRKLSILLRKTEDIVGTSTWNSILLGVTPEYARYLESTPTLWDTVNLNDHRASSQSINNLSNLSKLLLATTSDVDDGGEKPLISDIAFRFGFMRMPKLRKLHLAGRFKASQEMTREWRRRGRNILTSKVNI